MLTGGSRPVLGGACWVLHQAQLTPAQSLQSTYRLLSNISQSWSCVRSFAAQAAAAADQPDGSHISPELEAALLPKIALVGRPNVGKSALFNRLAGRRLSLVHDTPSSHVTRDWREARGRLADLQFTIIDTCGVEPTAPRHTIQARGTELTASMLQSVHLALMVIDARDGVLGPDEELAQWLSRHVPADQVLLLANKAEGNRAQQVMDQTEADAYRLGFGAPVAVSAATGEGLSDLYTALQPRIDQLREHLLLQHGLAPASSTPRQIGSQQQAETKVAFKSASKADEGDKSEDVLEQQTEEQDGPQSVRLAIMGLPNVGKSTLLNQLLGEQRVVTGPEPGLTRDPVAVHIHHDGQRIQLVDTAGYFGQTKMAQFDDVGGEVAARAREQTLNSLASSTVVALVVDAAEALRTQQVLSSRELSLVSQVVTAGRCLVVVANKMDSLPGRKERALYLRSLRDNLAERLQDAGVVQVVHMSAALGQNVKQLLPAVLQAHQHWSARLSTSQLNKWLRQQLLPSFDSGGGISRDVARIKYITQVHAGPPTFVCMVAGTQPMPDHVQAFLAGELRSTFNIPGTPMRFWFRYREPLAAYQLGKRQRRVRLRQPALPSRKAQAALEHSRNQADVTGVTAAQLMKQRAGTAQSERRGLQPLPAPRARPKLPSSQHAGPQAAAAVGSSNTSTMHHAGDAFMSKDASVYNSQHGDFHSQRRSRADSRATGRMLLSDQFKEWRQQRRSAR